MRSNEEKEQHCLICRKTIRPQKKIRICQDCRNRGKGATVGVVGLFTGVEVLRRKSKK